MRLCPREIEKIQLHNVGFIAQKRLALGIRLNVPEAVALIASQVLEMVRRGDMSLAEVMAAGRQILGKRHVLPGVAAFLDEIQVEGTFPDGSKLVTVHGPICSDEGDLGAALLGSGLTAPAPDKFPQLTEEERAVELGRVLPLGGTITLNAGRRTTTLKVCNMGDRPVQIGSHYHFIEANKCMKFDRAKSYGMRLNIPAGTAVRFEPGDVKTVALVDIAGQKVVRGGNKLVDGPVEAGRLPAILETLKGQGFLHEEEDEDEGAPAAKKAKTESPVSQLPRARYAAIYGPTTGDIVRLGDTSLYVRVEKDFCVYGDECKFGGGKVLREGMGQACGVGPEDSLETVITNALVLDYTGIYKADIGLRQSRISGIGKAGNPDTMDGVSPGMVVGVNTEVIAGEGLILTAGGVDTHIHFICPQQCPEALASGVTTMVGGGTGPSAGTSATTCTPGPAHLRAMLQATDDIPMNFGFTGKGNTSQPAGLPEVIAAGAIGLKLHEDWGTTPAAIDNCLNVAEESDIQVTIHTDTLNESCCVEDSIATFKGRTIHTYHSEGAGGGHAPDIIRVCGEPNVIPSSTNPTRPFTKNTLDEHLDMLMVCHHLDKNIPEDVAFAESRIRGETIAAEDILHDMGAISIMSSDSQAMGRVGEVVTRTWQTAHKMKEQRGQLATDAAADEKSPPPQGVSTDNLRARRYVSKYTINPAVAHGMSHMIGSIEEGKLADLVLWKPALFGAKPEMVIKGGQIAWSQMGDANASIPTPEPVIMRPMFGARAGAQSGPEGASVAFVSKACLEGSVAAKYGLRKRLEAVKNCRGVGKSDMKHNDALPKIEVDPETYTVKADGVELKCEPAQILPLAQKYFLF
mmetsp:Transcript_13869/g.20453  ORF Transcript_13869/g.20453 Transcript_13869/m.20453 type:complete len:858 (-) Transcript_13869:30-2603(-)